MAIFSGRTQPDPSSRPSISDDYELSKDQVLAIFKAAGDAELRRHIPEMQTDGRGHIGFICCGRTRTHDEWMVHTKSALTRATSTLPKR